MHTPDKRNLRCPPLLTLWLLSAAGAQAALPGFSYHDYAQVLQTQVNDQGQVDYEELRSNRAPLDRFVTQLATLDRETYDAWGQADQFAFWMNAYNSLTLKAVVDHYPLDSIRDIGSLLNSVWDKLVFTVMGETFTLNQIEHQVLRTTFADPRLHMAINCASIGCPPLGNRPLTGDRLDLQFESLTRAFLGDPTKFRIDRDRRTVRLSPIFKWFGEDFVPGYAEGHTWAGLDPEKSAVLNFILPHLSQPDQNYLKQTQDLRVRYLSYDWRLNRQ